MANEKEVYKLDEPHGLGDVFFSWQRGSGSYLATTGVDQTVAIFDRSGRMVERLRLPGMCAGFGWDADGDLLAVIAAGAPSVLLWDANTARRQQVDTGMRDPLSCVVWAKSGPLLAVGTARGNVAIYNHSTAKRVPVLGKHAKRVSCGAWSAGNLLALGSEDRTLSLSSAEGDTLRVVPLRAEPSDVQFSEMKLDERAGSENTVSMVLGKKTLFLYNLHEPDNPVELAFQQKYGAVVAYKWFGDGYILLGFAAGYLVAISTHAKEVGQELFQVKNHRDRLSDVAVCGRLGKVASCGDNTVKIHDTSNLQDTSAVLSLDQENAARRLGWSEDGQLLALAASSGCVHVFLTRLPLMHAACASRAALLSGLAEVSLYACDLESKGKPSCSLTLELPVEPGWLSLGPYHCAAGLNNRAWFYDLAAAGTPGFVAREREYVGNVASARLNAEYASVLYEGRIQLHLIEPGADDLENRETKMFPDSSLQEMNITCHALTTDFLIYASDMGHLHYFLLEDWKLVSEYRHAVGVRDVFPDQSGGRLAFVDDRSEGYVYSPVTDELLKIPDFPPTCNAVLWDSSPPDRNVLVAFDKSRIITYIYVKESINGVGLETVGETRLTPGHEPVLLCGGRLAAETPGGRLSQLALSTHEEASPPSAAVQEETLGRQLGLRKFDEAWKTCQVLNIKECWNQLAEATLRNLDIELAIRVYRHIGDVGMVWSLQDIQYVEDKKLLTGHVAMFLKEFEKAQEWYLASGRPAAALEMRRDLLQWDQALQLAARLAPEETPYIAREYAQQLEFVGNYAEALGHYEQGLLALRPGGGAVDGGTHVAQCRAGVARTAIRCGDVRRGVALASDAGAGRQLRRECAEILEGMKHYVDAASLYEKGQYFDKAASAYIRLKNWNKVGELLPHITSTKIHLQYAKAKEADGKYKEAADAYAAARDFDSVIRINLDHLNNPDEAVQVVKETKSIEGAKLVAKFFQRLDDYSSAIRFLLLSRCHDEAFQLARQHGRMELYGEVLSSSLDVDPRPGDFKSLALHFEAERNSLLAGKYFFHAGEHHKALKHLMTVMKANPENEEAVTLAIDVVGASNEDFLANQLIEFLLGESDNIPKDPKFLFRLYMARRQYREAAKTAIIIANEEQISGSYRNAHDMLFAMYQELRRHGIKVPAEMRAGLTLLHSYILVRLHVRRGEHLKGARMLVRVADSISSFPAHVVPILTSAVIECSRAGLKSAAFKYAAVLMRPEHRPLIDPKYAKRIEAVVRRPARGGGGGQHQPDDEREPETPCPFCDAPLPETRLDCGQCKNHVPFCVATGRHIVKDDLTACPNCDFPAIYSEFKMIAESGDPCPMCSELVAPERLIQIRDARPYLYPQGED
ncbi:WD repeat-containing protein 19 [Bacillus rossius redtenbacheri]|uniref:WD repeat-containing protein 19 n=1 Tax=Bacillus rossius redtenbacheri TaxID=93214 RepID=UPI002FDE1C4F